VRKGGKIQQILLANCQHSVSFVLDLKAHTLSSLSSFSEQALILLPAQDQRRELEVRVFTMKDCYFSKEDEDHFSLLFFHASWDAIGSSFRISSQSF